MEGYENGSECKTKAIFLSIVFTLCFVRGEAIKNAIAVSRRDPNLHESNLVRMLHVGRVTQ